MFRVIGDVIECDGKPFAVVTAPLSGQQLDMIDALNGIGFLTETEYGDALEEIKSDVNRVVSEALTAAKDELWLTEALTETLTERVQDQLVAFFRDQHGLDESI